jgi:putative ABC transport system substrate-binding protein
MRRREFITLLGGAAAWPFAAGAQQPAKVPTIGYLGGSTQAAESQRVAALVQRLRELSWIEGRNIAIEYRWAGAAPSALPRSLTSSSGSLAAKKATAVIPIVFPVAADPVGTGIVASLARPGGNVTGLSTFATDLAVKRLEILRDILPGLGRLAVMANVSAPGAALQMHEFHAAARPLGLEVVPLEIRRTEDIAPALESLKGRADALYVAGDPLASLNRVRINTFALVARLCEAWCELLRRSDRSHRLFQARVRRSPSLARRAGLR